MSENTDSAKGSFADKLYREITSVIGGDNPQQFFCMGLPGTLVDKTQYSYDIDKNEPKPALVEANESKLVNKLFDACKFSASDNGRHLQTQYKTALNMLTPRLNGKLFEAETKLREVLMAPYPYNFGDGTLTTGLTLQQVFYRLYGDYVSAKQTWAQMQVDKHNELAKKYSGATTEGNRKNQNEYLEWYGTTADPQLLKLEEKLGKVLCVFPPGDMEIITEILSGGSGGELAKARAMLANIEKPNPDGGFVYPVTLYPENWFTLLDTSSKRDVTPNSIPDNVFTPIIISSTMTEANLQSSSSAAASQSSYGVSFFFGGCSSNKSYEDAVSISFDKESSMQIQIGMSVAKVKIGREWFNPGVFLLSADMYNTSDEPIAPRRDYSEFSDERFDTMNQCVFSCFPTSFVIAKDITIQFFSSTAISRSFAQSVEDHSASGGGFFIFGGSSASSSNLSSSNSTATSTANSVTVRFTSPQIIGYYLEATPVDKSVSLSADHTNSDSDFIAIFDFITAFQQMLDDYKNMCAV